MNPTRLTQYANALVHVGANVQKGDGVWVQSDTEGRTGGYHRQRFNPHQV